MIVLSNEHEAILIDDVNSIRELTESECFVSNCCLSFNCSKREICPLKPPTQISPFDNERRDPTPKPISIVCGELFLK